MLAWVTYLEPSQILRIELFRKQVNGWRCSNILAKSFILDVWLGSEFSGGLQNSFSERFRKICRLIPVMVTFYK